MDDFLAGRMPAIAFPDLGMNMVHVEDVAAGVLLALDEGEIGQSYNLGGEITTMRGLITTLAGVAGQEAAEARRPDRLDQGGSRPPDRWSESSWASHPTCAS